ncbi:patched domain-containing protein 3-like [Chanos chanos]|uniref:Patched domain-containing protein 3 n=1 Tax=Chanos chanos TaxID=29144 RepID=A0A6J2UQF9_CHACN|nr:patched domain-containing protein 3-like [Chanos chanos]
MCQCRSDCIEKPISLGFKWLGHLIGRHPWWFLIIPLFISAGLGAGFHFLNEREVDDIEDQFTPVNGLAKKERAFVQGHFQEGEEFSHLRLSTEGTYASLIVASSHAKGILTTEAFKEILDLDRRVKEITVQNMSFGNICAKTSGECMSNPILDIVHYNASKIESTVLEYPIHNTGERKIALAPGVGGVKLKQNTVNEIDHAQAIRLFYFLKGDPETESLWLHAFLKTFSNSTGLETVSVSYFTSISREEEFKKNSDSVIPFFSVTYFLAITISIVSCLSLDCVRNKVWAAQVGVLSAGLAVLSSFGLLLLCGMPFSMVVATAPFLILGIGVDDMFIMISCWQRTKVHLKVEERLSEAYEDAAVSITITTLTDVLAFYIGLLTPFRSVQSFCMYTGTAVLFCYIYNITFFGAFLALNGKREASNRHWLTCMEVKQPQPNELDDTNDSKRNICCIGGTYDPVTGTEKEMPVDTFFKKYYGPFLTNNLTKACVMFLYAGYLAASIYGCFQIQEGIDLKNLAADGSYVGSYYDDEDKYFTEYGPNVMLVIKNSSFPYWDNRAREDLNSCLQRFRDLSVVSEVPSVSWLHSFMNVSNFNDENEFKNQLNEFLQRSNFSQDVNFTNNNIHASRMFAQTCNISTAVDEKEMLNDFRKAAENCRTSDYVDLLVYHPAFIYFDQYTVIVSNTIQNIIVATVIMLCISLLLIPNPVCSLWVTLAIASVITGVAGFMALWDVNLDSISMINLVICIGFSVDFSAHISYAFVSSKKSSGNERAIDALYNLGYPIIQGAVSTVAGVVVLSAAQSYIFRTFFKIMFLVILFGVAHGIVFIPVFLTFFGVCCQKSDVNSGPDEGLKQQHADNNQQTYEQ